MLAWHLLGPSYGCVWKLVSTPKPNGFADHYPYISLLNGYFIGGIPNIFRHTHMDYMDIYMDIIIINHH